MSPWVLKNEEEYKELKRKKLYSPVLAIFVFILFVCIGIFSLKTGDDYYYGFTEPATWTETIDFLPKLLLISAIISGILYLMQSVFEMNINDTPRTVICPKCGKVKTEDKQKYCLCGEQFQEIEKYKWIEDSDDSKTSTN